MFTVDNFKVVFHHTKLHKKAGGNRITVCDIITLNEDGSPRNSIASGISKCNKEDQYNKNMGRKTALGYALNRIFKSNKAMRAKFWKAYFEKRGKVD